MPDSGLLPLTCTPNRRLTVCADFHAGGRHTHITDLLRDRASPLEAQVPARHADINMNMTYTYFGMQDQAKALKVLPTSWQRIGQLSEAT